MSKRLLPTLYLVFSLLIIITGCSKRDYAKKNHPIFDDAVIHKIELFSVVEPLEPLLTEGKEYKIRTDTNVYQMCRMKIDSVNYDSVGIRYKGQSSYDYQPNRKKSFKVKLNKFIKNQTHQKQRKFNLNNNFKDPSFMREKLTLDLLREEGVPSQQSSYTEVYLDGELLGLYLLVEEIDKPFLKENFGTAKGKLYNGKPKAWLSIEEDSTITLENSYRRKNRKKSTDYSELQRLITAINEIDSSGQYKYKLDEYIDLDQVAKQWAISNFLVNIDAYNLMKRHNYMLYFLPENKEQFCNWIGYDFNYSFAAWTPIYSLEDACKLDIHFVDTPFHEQPFAYRLLKREPIFLAKYDDCMKRLCVKLQDEQWVKNKVDELFLLIEGHVQDDPYKNYTYQDFVKNIYETIGDALDPGAFSPGLVEFIDCRAVSIRKQLQKQ